MTAEKFQEKSCRNCRINLTQKLNGNKAKRTDNHTVISNPTAKKTTCNNRGASKLVKLKKTRDNPAVTCKIANSHPKELQARKNNPVH